MASTSTGGKEFAAVLIAAASNAPGEVTKIIEVGARKIQKQLQADMRKSSYFKGAARNISYDMDTAGGNIAAEIGPETGRGRPGAISNIAYFGGANGGGGTVRDPELALTAEGAIVSQLIADALVEAFQ